MKTRIRLAVLSLLLASSAGCASGPTRLPPALPVAEVADSLGNIAVVRMPTAAWTRLRIEQPKTKREAMADAFPDQLAPMDPGVGLACGLLCAGYAALKGVSPEQRNGAEKVISKALTDVHFEEQFEKRLLQLSRTRTRHTVVCAPPTILEERGEIVQDGTRNGTVLVIELENGSLTSWSSAQGVASNPEPINPGIRFGKASALWSGTFQASLRRRYRVLDLDRLCGRLQADSLMEVRKHLEGS